LNQRSVAARRGTFSSIDLTNGGHFLVNAAGGAVFELDQRISEARQDLHALLDSLASRPGAT